MPASHTLTRVLAAAALVAVLLVVGAVLLGNRGGSYTVDARFQNASQLVKGNLVQVAGVPVGKIQSIDLTPDGQADVTHEDHRRGLSPRCAAARRRSSARPRCPAWPTATSTSSSRRPTTRQTIPAGGVIDQSDTTTAVDLDQLFNTFDPKTRKALQRPHPRLRQPSYAGKGEEANAGWAYLNPSLAASSRLFKELDSDTPALKRFIGESSQLVGDLADAPRLTSRASSTTSRPRPAPSAARSRRSRPRSATCPASCAAPTPPSSTCAPRSTTSSRSSTSPSRWPRSCAPSWPSCARWPATRARRCATSPRSCARPGASNDLIELTKSSVPVRNVAVGPTKRDGKQRDGAFPASTKALAEAAPELATARPYAPDLTGWFDDFGHSGLYDALGGASRAAPYVNALRARQRRAQAAARPAWSRATPSTHATSLNQRWRCPGSVERGATWKPNADFPCDASQGPLGP